MPSFAHLETPKILFLRHYRSASDGWKTCNLCAACCRDCTPSIQSFLNKCTFPRSYSNYPNICKFNLCLRKPLPSVIKPQIPSFISLSICQSSNLPPEHCYHHYLHAANSHHVPQHKLILHTGICLQSAYARHCVNARQVYTNTAFLAAMFVGVHSTSNTMLVTRLSQH